MSSHERAHIQAQVYRAADGIRWRITSSARGRRILSESSEAYAKKADAFRSLLLTTGGEWTSLLSWSPSGNHVIEQGVVVRGIKGGLTEEIFVEYVSGRAS